MKTQGKKPFPSREEWHWPVDITQYDRSPALSTAEYAELTTLVNRFDAGGTCWHRQAYPVLHRLLQPLNDALDVTDAHKVRTQRASVRTTAIHLVIRAMHRLHVSFWAFTPEQWREILGPDCATFSQHNGKTSTGRQHLVAVSYLLCGFQELKSLGRLEQYALAVKVFGKERVDAAIQSIEEELRQWGYGKERTAHYARNALCEAMLANRSPRLEDLTTEVLDAAYQATDATYIKQGLVMLSSVLHKRSLIARPLDWATQKKEDGFQNRRALKDVPTQWAQWCQRWYETSTWQPSGRENALYRLLQTGRWLAHAHPEVTSPQQWTRELVAEYVASVDHMTVGQWSNPGKMLAEKLGKPFGATSKEKHLESMRVFFRDCQEWGWIPRHFNPERSFATPHSIRAKIGPNPRVIADDIWAKLLWAGLNLTEADIPAGIYTAGRSQRGSFYPVEMIQALVMVWLFCGLRRNEILRLRVGCIRWQREEVPLIGTGEVLPKEAVCLLDVPVNKTSAAFTKPVDRVVGEAIAQWERVRPAQPPSVDTKTGERVDYLFAYRGKGLGQSYLNDRLIPMLCRKAGVEERDARGTITSHRARSTIASQLYNAKDPMTLMELREWLGHSSLGSTQYYTQISPTKLAKSFSDAGYFKRNLRTIEVLIDQDAVKSGAAANGEPWKFYDLGHGYCTYDFFDQCPHRMACAKCVFYRPKGSSQAQILEAKANLLRMKQEIPLSEEERGAVDDGLEALEKLTEKLIDVPTPAGPTPRELQTGSKQMLPVLPRHAIIEAQEKP